LRGCEWFSREVAGRIAHTSRTVVRAAVAAAVAVAVTALGAVAAGFGGGQPSQTGPVPLRMFDVGPRLSNGVAKTQQGPSGFAISLAVSGDGRRVYAGTWGGGLWRSDDGGAHWRQLTYAQSGDRLLPICSKAGAPARLPATVIGAVAVSPTNPDLVFAGTIYDRDGCGGIYRSLNGGKSWMRVFYQRTNRCPGGSANGFAGAVQPVTEIAFAPDDGTKLWAVSGCVVVWSSVGMSRPGDAPVARAPKAELIGATWQPTTPSMPMVGNLAVGRYERSLGGGAGGRAVWVCGAVAPGASGVQLYSSVDGGRNYVAVGVNPSFGCGSVWGYNGCCGGHMLAADTTTAVPTVYLLDPNPNGQTAFGLVGQPPNGGAMNGITRVVRDDRAATPAFTVTRHPGPPRLPDAWGSGNVLLTGFRSTGSRLMLVTSNDEDVFLAAAPPATQADWHRLTGTDASVGCVPATATCPTTVNWNPRDKRGSLHDDVRTFAVVPGTKVGLGGRGVASTPLASCGAAYPGATTMLVSNDGGVAASRDCGSNWNYGDLPNLPVDDLAGLVNHGQPPALYFGGRDDGDWASYDGGAHWKGGVGSCGDCTGFYALQRTPSLIANVYRTNLNNVPGQGACCRWIIYVNQGAFAKVSDAAQRAADWDLTPEVNWPRMSTNRGWSPLIQPLAGEAVPTLPSLALVRAANTMWNGNPDYAALSGWSVHRRDLRPSGTLTPTQIDTTIGTLPSSILYPLVETSGGARKGRTTFYVAGRTTGTGTKSDASPSAFINSETDSVYRAEGPGYRWVCIVPSGAGCTDPTPPGGMCPSDGACHAYKLAVDPFTVATKERIYLADTDGAIKESRSNGTTWFTNRSLTDWLTEQHRLSNAPHCLWYCSWEDSDEELRSMLFSASEQGTAFAAGISGVYMTLDSGCSQSGSAGGCRPGGPGEKWHRILDSASTACQPTSMFFDADEPDGRALYVGCNQRGVLKLLGIPRPSDWQHVDGVGFRVRFDPASQRVVTTGVFPPQPRRIAPSPPDDEADNPGAGGAAPGLNQPPR
jgi:hypothetical protein